METTSSTPRGDFPYGTTVTPGEDAHTILLNRIAWGAVLAGVAVALVAQLLLNMLGLGIGAATLDPATGESPETATFTMAAAIWWTASGVIAAFLGGLAAGRLSGRAKQTTAAWHGLTAWAVTTLVVAYFVTSAVGTAVGGGLNMLGNVVGGAGQAAVDVAAPAVAEASDPFAAIERQVRRTTGGMDPADLGDAAVASVRAVVTGDEAEAAEAREEAAQALAAAQNISIEEARAQVGRYEEQYRAAAERARQEAAQAAEAVGDATAQGALWGFVALLLGAVAGWFGGWLGTVALVPTVGREPLYREPV